jgi:hypothetical protein
VKGVNFLLFSPNVKAEDTKGCDTTPLKTYRAPGNKQPLCHVVSNQGGAFSFSSLPTGDYSLVPFYKGEQITFDVIPAKMDFKVGFDSFSFEVGVSMWINYGASVLARIFFKGGVFNPLHLNAKNFSKDLNRRKNCIF